MKKEMTRKKNNDGPKPASKDFYSKGQNVALADAIDRVIEKGAYLEGNLLLQIADIDLIIIRLKLMVSSVDQIDKNNQMAIPSQEDQIFINRLEEKIKDMEKSIPQIMATSEPQKTEKGFAKLILTLVELIKELMEREAFRKIESGNLNQIQIKKIGLSFTALDKKIEELKKVFGIEEDLNLDLGPLGKLL